MNSVWNDGFERISFNTLKGNINTDVLVIGGGLAGLLSTYRLKKEGVDCVLVEAGLICDGVSANTTAKITFQHGLIYNKLIKSKGLETAKLYLNAHKKALKEYDSLCKEVSCDYEKKDSFVYSCDDRALLQEETEALIKLGENAVLCKDLPLPFETAGAVCVKDQAQFHPLKFAYGIAKDLPVYENTKVIEIKDGAVITERGRINCKKIIVATHFPILNKHGSYFMKMYQYRSYVLALEGAENVNGMYVDEKDSGLSFRNYGKLLLLGGGGHRTGKTGGAYGELEAFSKIHYPSARTYAKWATQDCITLDGVSYIGKYSKATPDLYVATGFNKWGMTSSMLSSMILSDLILERENEYASVFSPSRNILHPQLAVNAFESVKGLLSFSRPRCSHLGCALKYNKAEHSWDCSCHGSRFSESGKLINNPANKDIEPKR